MMKQQEHLDQLQKEREMMARVMALTDGYFSLFTVDLETGRFLEYSSSDEYNRLGTLMEGDDFFRQTALDAANHIYPEDQAAFIAQFTKENIIREIQTHGSYKIQYRLMMNGEPKPVTLKVAMFREGEEEKLVVGVRVWRERQ